MILDEMREGLQVIDFCWQYLYLNRAAAVHARRSREDLLGHTLQECYPGIERSEMFALLQRCMAERVSASMSNEFRFPDGASGTFELKIVPCKMGILILTTDVTEARKIETQYRHSQKMEAIGRLAGSVAHDFNNVLSVILGYTSILLDDLTPPSPMRTDIEAIRQAAERASQLTRQLLTFSRQQSLKLRVTSLNDVVSESESMLHRLLGEDIELVTHLDREVFNIKADSGQLDQVIMNLAVNARDAMPTGGQLTIETENVVLDESYATGHFGVIPGRYVMLAISDNGAGMNQETQARMFEPFFTTKGPGKGTGLGLATVFGIVRQSGGNIWVYSEPGHGTTFRIYFPAVDGELVSAQQPIAPAVLDGNETVLLVEDQDDVRGVAKHILVRHGYHVLEARNGDEAMSACEQYRGVIDLLLTDVVMPHINGRELANRLLKMRPGMKVLYMSGYTENAVIRHGVLDAGIEYLQKPFLPEQLVRRVREAVDMPVACTVMDSSAE
jgi:signal transduction histidine kinase/ActR/RegA family two-component response regulator